MSGNRLVVVFMLLMINLSGCKKKDDYLTETPPDNLPSYMQPLEGASDVLYHSNTYVTYVMNESFPAKKTIALLEDQLEENEFVKLKRQLLYPNVIQALSWSKHETQDGVTCMYWQEDWLNSEKELVTFTVSYCSEQLECSNQSGAQIQIRYNCSDKLTVGFIANYMKVNPDEYAKIVGGDFKGQVQ